MAVHIALLRAVNVGGTGKLPMADLRAMCEQLGFGDVRTYIQTGNVICTSPLAPAQVEARLEAALTARFGKPAQVLVRTLPELEQAMVASPFVGEDGKRVLVVFLDNEPARGVLDAVVVPGRERLSLQGRELFIHYPDGMGRSKLKVPALGKATSRNLNTLRALVEMARGLAG